jgi:hypothetical protein
MGTTPQPPRPQVRDEEHQQYCPLASVVAIEGTHLPCGKGECAWWDSTDGKCAVLLLAQKDL